MVSSKDARLSFHLRNSAWYNIIAFRDVKELYQCLVREINLADDSKLFIQSYYFFEQ